MSLPSQSEPLGPLGRLLCTVYVAGLGVPLFILPGYLTTNLTKIFKPSAPASLDDQPLQIHWIVVLAGLVAGYLAIRVLTRGRLYAPSRTGLIAGLGLVFLLALAAGLVVSPSWLNGVYFFQTTVPLVGFLVGAYLADSVAGMRRIALVLVTATAISIALILVLAFHFGALSSSWSALRSLIKAIPQLLDYFPFIVAASLSLGLASYELVSKRSQKALLVLAMVIHLLFYTITWSRMALVMLAVVVVSRFLFFQSSRLDGRWIRRAAVTLALLVGGAILVAQFSVLPKRWQGGFRQSDSRRVDYAVTAAKTIARQPIFGRMFIADWERDPLPERSLRIRRVFKAHNQYLDYGLRAGLPAMVLLGWIILAVARDLRAALKSFDDRTGLRPMVVGVTGALLAVLLGNFTQLFLVQAQTGSLAWLLVGVAVRMAGMARPGGARRPQLPMTDSASSSPALR